MTAREIHNIRIHYARWQDLPPEVKATFAGFMGEGLEQGKAFYQLYFYWYNIAHEIGHTLRTLYGAASGKIWEEEMAVNQLAIAYWRAKGQMGRLLQLESGVRLALSHLADPVPADQDRVQYLNKHFQELGNNPAAYGHYQFSMVKAALERPLDFPQALRTLVTPRASDGATIPLAPDFPLDDQLPYRIVDDMRKTLAAYGLRLPEVQLVCAYAPALQFVLWEK